MPLHGFESDIKYAISFVLIPNLKGTLHQQPSQFRKFSLKYKVLCQFIKKTQTFTIRRKSGMKRDTIMEENFAKRTWNPVMPTWCMMSFTYFNTSNMVSSAPFSSLLAGLSSVKRNISYNIKKSPKLWLKRWQQRVVKQIAYLKQ